MRKTSMENVKITHIFADGKVMSDEEFMAKPFVVEFERNQSLFEEAVLIGGATAALERENRRRIRTSARREKLQKEAQRIQEELAKLE